ncbi:uncharacterized protein A4U43_C08F22540 [Asparagus officinalis]|nr:uncharacterized protein A4U43_C08F22540 [Asparagus officinalis]
MSHDRNQSIVVLIFGRSGSGLGSRIGYDATSEYEDYPRYDGAEMPHSDDEEEAEEGEEGLSKCIGKELKKLL